ncbi:hypothetical protein H312_02582 [Anncaliia algerae PRA339]|uniref:Uncharacterized protein n=1 Tax=Anncaliia algerae PRA339 TaxID=1288291 RepID=A0A059EYP7_9MICR|nr:hypothetical protein H312_02582 [Anncaliia algerae PRA339]
MRSIQYKNTFRCKCTRFLLQCQYFKKFLLFNSNTKINKIVNLIYFWLQDYSHGKVKNEIECNSQTIVCEWFKKLQKLSYVILRGESKTLIECVGYIVEIDGRNIKT